MKLVITSLLLLFSLLAVSSTAEKFDFFYLVQQWPGSFCDTRQGCCFSPETGKPAAAFGIHGLWPNYAKCQHGRRQGLARAMMLGDGDGDGDAFLSAMAGVDVDRRRGKCWPEYCGGGGGKEELSPWEIRDLAAALGRSWPTLSCKNRRGFEFWSYEWRKHGTCSGMEPHDYFARALALRDRHDLAAILAGAGIVPSDAETYPVSGVIDAVARGTGFRANVECNRGADGEAQLFQVYQCVDVDAEELIDCPLAMPSKCTDRVKLPVF